MSLIYIEVFLFQGVGIEEFHCIQRCPHFRSHCMHTLMLIMKSLMGYCLTAINISLSLYCHKQCEAFYELINYHAMWMPPGVWG